MAEPRVRKTHLNPAVCAFLKDLPLKAKLLRNKTIEAANDALSAQRLDAVYQTGVVPADGIDAASFITISDEEKDTITALGVWGKFKDLLTIPLLQELSQRMAYAAKRKSPDDDSDSDSDRDSRRSRSRKSVFIDRLETTRVYGMAQVMPIPDLLVVTDAHYGIPLTWCLPKALEVLNGLTIGSLIPTKKIPHPSGEGTVVVWDVAYVLKSTDERLVGAGMTEILCASYGEFTEAGANHKRLMALRDIRENAGKHTHEEWAECHYGFFKSQERKVELYDKWSVLEVKIREARRQLNTKFDLNHHVHLYEKVVDAVDIAKEVAASMAAAAAAQSSNRSFRNQGSSGPQSSKSGDKPRADNPNAVCVLCARKGHSAQSHDGARHPKTFEDGSAFWAKKKADHRGLFTNDGASELCINWNLTNGKGRRGPCTHTAESRLHLCSFCGSADHHAGAWTCRARA